MSEENLDNDLSPNPVNPLERYNRLITEVRNEVQKVVIGQQKMIDLFLVALFTKGHVIVEGVPGIAKTLTSKLLAKTIAVDYSRIQFTPDLMPADVIGTTVFNMKESVFAFKQGPIFSNVVLIDEINRSPAKTQAALFEVMEERQITSDGTRYPMEEPFVVIATQNPIEQEGTYKLPEAQLDRFLFRIKLDYPSLSEEKRILHQFKSDFDGKKSHQVGAVLDAAKIKECQELVEQIHIKDELIDYIAHIIHNTRNNGDLFLGASPRASLSIMKSAKAMAAMKGRDFVIPEDIQFVVAPVLNHRIQLSAEREMEGLEPEDIIKEIIKKVEVPR